MADFTPTQIASQASPVAIKTKDSNNDPKKRLENKYGICLPVTYINNLFRDRCGTLKWSAEAKIASAVIFETVLTTALLEAAETLPAKRKFITPSAFTEALLQDSTNKRIFEGATFDVYPEFKRNSKKKAKEQPEANKPKEKRARTEATKSTPIAKRTRTATISGEN